MGKVERVEPIRRTDSRELIAFWRSCPLDSPPFIHPADRPALAGHNGDLAEIGAIDFGAYVSGPGFGNHRDHRLQLSLVPVPYAGDLAHADIFLLQLNPGFRLVDYYGESRMPGFRARLQRNLLQELDGVEFPFPFLDPELCWHSGFMWWEEKLREIATILAQEKYRGNYLKALREISRRLVALELVPYHSASFRDHRLLPVAAADRIPRQTLASAIRAQRFAIDYLLPKATRGEVLIVATRQVTAWGLGSVRAEMVIKYSAGLARGASLSPRTPGGQAILRKLGIGSASRRLGR